MSDPESTPLAPPTQPGAIAAPVRPSNWPSVIGIIAIVFGCLGSLQGVLGALSPLTTAFFRPFMLKGQAEVIQQTAVWNVASSIAGLVIGALLLFGGILIKRRQRRAVFLLRGWAVAKILFALVGIVVGYQVAQLQLEAIQNDPNAAVLGTGVLSTLGTIGVILGATWLCVLPIFILVWFSRSKIKTEVAGWT